LVLQYINNTRNVKNVIVFNILAEMGVLTAATGMKTNRLAAVGNFWQWMKIWSNANTIVKYGNYFGAIYNEDGQKEGSVNHVPAAAVIRLILTLSYIIGCKASVGTFQSFILNIRKSVSLNGIN